MFTLPKHSLVPITIVAFLHYVYFRGLAYLDSKELLAMPGRKEPGFGFRHTMIILPIVLCLYVATGSALYPTAWGYTAVVYSAYTFLVAKRV